MYCPSAYIDSRETEREFSKLIFNRVNTYENIVMCPHPIECYDEDGKFIDKETNRILLYDWSFHRTDYFANCVFKHGEFSMFARKLDDDKHKNIQMFVQRDSTNTGIAVAWAVDVKAGERRIEPTKKDNGIEQSPKLFTDKFRVYPFEDIESFKCMIAHAIKFQEYSFKIFEIMDDIKSNKYLHKITSNG